METKDKEVLLRVEQLCQYFKLGKSELKAVNKVSFNIYKGEVFGLVGESGCGKTTTGRSIIKLYESTGGNVYFKDQRICAGNRLYKDAIAAAKEDCADTVRGYEAEIKEETAKNPANEATIKEKYHRLISEKREETSKIIKENRVAIKEARDDQRNCDKKYSARRVAELKAEYEPIFANATPDKLPEIKKEYNKKLHIAKRERLVTQIQMIFQDPIASLNPRMTVETIVSEGLIIKGVRDKAYIQEKVYEALEQVGLVREHATRYPHEFSGGQRQRIGIARSIIMRPDLIIADEPISALDVSIQAQVINLLNDLRSQLGLTIMFIAHDLSVVKYFSDRIGVMYYGNLVELTSSDELFKHPFHPYTRSLLSAIPSPDPIYEKKRKRITYNPLVDHDYSKEQPTLREVLPGHFVLCNTAEMEEYRRIAAEKDLIQKAE